MQAELKQGKRVSLIRSWGGLYSSLQFEFEDASPGDVVVSGNSDTGLVYTDVVKGLNKVELISKTRKGILVLKARNADQTEVMLEAISF